MLPSSRFHFILIAASFFLNSKETLEADFVIVALPLGALKALTAPEVSYSHLDQGKMIGLSNLKTHSALS